MNVFPSIGALENAIGTHIGYSDWYLVTQEQIDTFAKATWDHQWIHTEPDKAALGPYGRTIAHGYLTLSLVPALTYQVYRVEGILMGVNYGADKLRFPAPVLVGSRVRAGVEVVSLQLKSAGYQLRTKVTIECEGVDKPACVVETLTILVP